MAVGFPKARAHVGDRAGSFAGPPRNTFDGIDQFKLFLDSTPDADLTSAPYNYTAGDVAVLKSAYNDLAKLAQIYRGEIEQSPAYDFRTFAHQLTGVL